MRLLPTIFLTLASLDLGAQSMISVTASNATGELVRPTNFFVGSLFNGSNVVIVPTNSGMGWGARIHSMASGTGGGTNLLVQTNGVNVGSAGTMNWTRGVTGDVAGAVVTLGVNLDLDAILNAATNYADAGFQANSNRIATATNDVTTNLTALIQAATNSLQTNIVAWTNTVTTNVIGQLLIATNSAYTNFSAWTNTVTTNVVGQLTVATNDVTTNLTALIQSATNTLQTNIVAWTNTLATNFAAADVAVLQASTNYTDAEIAEAGLFGLTYMFTSTNSGISNHFIMHRLDVPVSSDPHTNSVIPTNGVYAFSYRSALPMGVDTLRPGFYTIHFHAWMEGPGASCTLTPEIYVQSDTYSEIVTGGGVTLDTVSGQEHSQVVSLSTNVTGQMTNHVLVAFKSSNVAGPSTIIYMYVEGISASGITVPVPSSAFVLASEYDSGTNTVTTNLTASLSGYQPADRSLSNISSGVTFIDITAPPYSAVGDGVTDNTVAFQNALTNVGATVVVPWTSTGYLVTNLIVTNGITLRGLNGNARLLFGLNATNYMLDCRTNGWGITLRDMVLDGQSNVTFKAISGQGVRNAVRMASYGTNNLVDNVYFTGWSGYGVELTHVGPDTGTAPFITVNARVRNCGFENTYMGLLFGPARAEYTSASGIRATGCRYAVEVQSGNVTISDLVSYDNGYGFSVSSNVNNGHGTISGSSFNHNTYIAQFYNLSHGFVMENCQMWQGILFLWGCTGLRVSDCQGAPTEIRLRGGGTNWISDCTFENTYGCTITHNSGGEADHTIIENVNIAGLVVDGYSLNRYGSNLLTGATIFGDNVTHTNAASTLSVPGIAGIGTLYATNFPGQQPSSGNLTNLAGTGAVTNRSGSFSLNLASQKMPTNNWMFTDWQVGTTYAPQLICTTNTSAYFTFNMPMDYVSNTMTLHVDFGMLTGITNNMVVGASVMCQKPDGSTDQTAASFDTEQTAEGPVPGTLGANTNLLVNLAGATDGLEAGNLCVLRVRSAIWHTNRPAIRGLQVRYERQ